MTYYAGHKKRMVETMLAWQRANPERRTFYQMKQRCNNPNSSDYPGWGGQGIKVLYGSFDDFIADVGKKPGKGYSIDRINNKGNYEPGNCRWATAKQQIHNRG